MRSRIIDLFARTQHLHAHGLQLTEVCLELHQISLNAAISASHLESSFSEFPVLARQIGLVAKGISEGLIDIDKSISTASNCILDALRSAMLCEKYVQSRSPGQNLKNSDSEMTIAIRNMYSIIQQKKNCYSQSLTALLQQVAAMEQLIVRSWGIVPYMRIAVHSSRNEQAQSFLDIAKTIEELNEKANGLIRQIHKDVQAAKGSAQFLTEEEWVDAA